MLEAMMYTSLFALTSVAIMKCIAQASNIEDRMQQKSELLLLAQSELERLRLEPEGLPEENPWVYQPINEPETVSIRVDREPRENELQLMTVTAERKSTYGDVRVALETLVRQGGDT